MKSYTHNELQSQSCYKSAIAPPVSHSPVIYPIAILKNSKNQTAAKALYVKHPYTVVS
ncbi:hypothetical protein [Nostoc sp. MS1]|uniref:hypothetical protein n=1 Tax=Nostoc sp. MS1 TaxID=2764711 RepID=UPI001CC5A893|nr:hypothetical protein [Nostoc sp. MS1]